MGWCAAGSVVGLMENWIGVVLGQGGESWRTGASVEAVHVHGNAQLTLGVFMMQYDKRPLTQLRGPATVLLKHKGISFFCSKAQGIPLQGEQLRKGLYAPVQGEPC